MKSGLRAIDRRLRGVWHAPCCYQGCTECMSRKELLMASHEKETSTRIDRRDAVSPREGEREYGDVEFADPVNKKYPVDTPEHIRAAWSYIHHKDNAAKYDRDEVELIESRIKRAAKRAGVEISED